MKNATTNKPKLPKFWEGDLFILLYILVEFGELWPFQYDPTSIRKPCNGVDRCDPWAPSETIEGQSSDSNTYRGNKIVGSRLIGIEILEGSGTTIEGNEIEDGRGEGITIINGTDVEIIGNTLTDNRIDICWDAAPLPSPMDGELLHDENDFETGALESRKKSKIDLL